MLSTFSAPKRYPDVRAQDRFADTCVKCTEKLENKYIVDGLKGLFQRFVIDCHCTVENYMAHTIITNDRTCLCVHYLTLVAR